VGLVFLEYLEVLVFQLDLLHLVCLEFLEDQLNHQALAALDDQLALLHLEYLGSPEGL
jgi:hypothetical protein